MKSKIKINTHLKFMLISVFTVLAIFLIYLQYSEGANLKTKSEDKVVFNYTATSEIDYKVNIIENKVYNTTVLPSDSTYIASLLNSIDIDFKHIFEGVRASDIDGTYNIISTINGKIGSETGSVLWTRDYVLKPSTKFNLSSTNCSINDNVKIDYNIYNSISKELNSLTGVSTNDTLNVTMNVIYSAKTDKGVVEEVFSPTLSMPLNTSYFNIERLNIEEKDGEIKNIVDVVQPPNMLKIIIFRIAIGLLIVLTLILIFITDKPSLDDIYKKKIKKIFKTHGVRLVAINNELIMDDGRLQYVHSIDDLVKISDELGKPIIYIYNVNIIKMDRFYVIDNNESYVYTVSYPISDTDGLTMGTGANCHIETNKVI